MSTVSSPTACAESSTTPTKPSGSLRAAYEAAVAAYQHHVSLMIPIGSQCVVLKQKHERMQARSDKLSAAITSLRSTYQQHKRYVSSLSNSLLASQTALASAPNPPSDFQWLMHATLLHNFFRATDTLIVLYMQKRRLKSASDRCISQDQAFRARCQALLKTIDEDSEKTDELHAKVIEAALEMGENPECHLVEGRCASCNRNEERKMKKLATDNALREKAPEENDGKGGKVRNERRKEVDGKQRLEGIPE